MALLIQRKKKSQQQSAKKWRPSLMSNRHFVWREIEERRCVLVVTFFLLAILLLGCAAKVPQGDGVVAEEKWANYQDITRLFALRYPSDWIIRQRPVSEGFTVAFTPISDTSIPIEDLQTVAKVAVFFTPFGNPHAYLKPEEVFARERPIYEAVNRKYNLRFDSQEMITLPGVKGPVVKGRFHALMAGIPVQEDYIRVPRPGWTLVLVCDYPKGNDSLKVKMETIQQSLKLPESPCAVPEIKQAVEIVQPDLVKKVRECTVLVVVKDDKGKVVSTGSGFFIHPAGYLLTNAHVVTEALEENEVEKPSLTRFEVHWDRRVGRDSMPADYVAHVKDDNHELDLGLLHVDATNCPYLMPEPPTGVENLTEVITTSFPEPDMNQDGFDITYSDGKITRINHDVHERVRSFFTNAQVGRGSSGSPCVDAHTGRILGVNTYVSRGELAVYVGMQPIERAYENFAELYYPPEGSENMTVFDHFKLACLFWGLQCPATADRELSAACLIDASNPHAWTLRGLISEVTGDTEKAKQCYEKVLRYDSKNTTTLSRLASIALSQEKFDYQRTSELVENLIKAAPEDFNGFILRGLLNRKNNHFDKALSDYRKAAELSNDLFAEPHIEIARIYLEQNDANLAREAVEKALTIDPTNDEALLLIDEIDADRLGANLDRFNRLAAMHHNHPVVQWLLGRALVSNEDMAGAEKCYQISLKLFIGREMNIPLEYFDEAGEFGLQHNVLFALQVYETMYQSTPDDDRLNAMALLGMSQALLRMEDRDDVALALYKFAKEQDEDYIKTYLNEHKDAMLYDGEAKMTEDSAIFVLNRWNLIFATAILTKVEWDFEPEDARKLTEALKEKNIAMDDFVLLVKLLKVLLEK